jgi:hypothetical protein
MRGDAAQRGFDFGKFWHAAPMTRPQAPASQKQPRDGNVGVDQAVEAVLGVAGAGCQRSLVRVIKAGLNVTI